MKDPEVPKEVAQEIAALIRLYAASCGAKRKADSDPPTRRSLCNRLYAARKEDLLTRTQLVRLVEASAAIDWAEDFDLKFRDWLNGEIAAAFKLPKPVNKTYA